jgi:hypothetical protein
VRPRRSRTQQETEQLLGLSQGYLSKPKAALSRRVQAGLSLLRQRDGARRQAQEFSRYLALLDEVFPDVSGDDHDVLIAKYRERLTILLAKDDQA